MKTYVVGGAVRDGLLGLPVQDRDHVVVGASPDAMLAAGFLPVGRDFPVFLHPHTREEYALARTERKSGRGYQGFTFYAAPDVSLEADLARRDLTINAMALDEASGELVDPYGGRRDLEARVLRHVSAAFTEDPVRILRVARFAARFAEFTVAPETFDLLCHMVANGEVDHLVPERVWQELARGLMEAHPARMLELLHACGALARIAPGLERYWQGGVAGAVAGAVLAVLERAAAEGLDLASRFALLTWRFGAGDAGAAGAPAVTGPAEAAGATGAAAADHGPVALASLCERLRVPNDCRDLALMLAREQAVLSSWATAATAATGAPAAADVLALFERCDALRRPERCLALLAAWRLTVCMLPGADGPAIQGNLVRLSAALEAARGLDAGAVARAVPQPAGIPAAVRAARLRVVAASLAAS